MRAPVDIVYGDVDEEPPDDYDDYVEGVRERSTTAFAEVRSSLGKAAERNKKYYDLGVKSQKFQKGEWVLYFNPRKYRGKQNKWVRNYEGPFLVIDLPSTLTAKIQKSVRATLRSFISTS